MDEWSGSSVLELHGFNSCDKVLKMTHVVLQKRFPIYHVCPKMHGGPSLSGAATRMKASTILQVSDVLGKNTGRLVTCEFPLRTDSAS